MHVIRLSEANLARKKLLDRSDALLLTALVLLSLLAAARYDLSCHPEEDAAMLMRYSQHLAGGHGIVWNIGEKHVDGATDFLFMIALACLARSGLPLETASILVGMICHVAATLLVYLAIVRLHRGPRWAALASSAYLAVGTGTGYAAAGFGTPFFALTVSIAWYLAIVLSVGGNSRVSPALFAAAALLMGLDRPEGVLLGILMLAAVVYARGMRQCTAIVAWFIVAFGTVGSAYFLWRWSYFGYPLPNPYYVKGGHIHFVSLAFAVRNTAIMCLPVLPLLILGLRKGPTSRATVTALIPIAGFTCMWVLLSNEMNYLMRYQYAVVPIALMSWPPAVRGLRNDWRLPELRSLDRRSRALICFLAVMAGVMLLALQQVTCLPPARSPSGLRDVATILRRCGPNHTLATTEAGLLPFYSNWRAVDTWGLNDQWIAHHEGISETYLDRYRPDVIMIHASFSPVMRPRPESGLRFLPSARKKAWFAMVMTLMSYAKKHCYVLAAAFGVTPDDAHYYYIRPGMPEGRTIAREIRDMDYYVDGRKALDYAHPRSSGTGG